MGNQDFGESSRKTQNDDNSRPLKKAKYVWQVKGKYHLKGTCLNNRGQAPDSNRSAEADSHVSKEEVCKGKCVEKLLAREEVILENLEDDPEKNLDASILEENPFTFVTPNLRNDDYYIHQWQARQLARSYIDNTINSVLETCINVPFDVENLVENCDNDGQVEDEAISMAIQSHGLQPLKNNVKGESLAFASVDEVTSSTLNKLDNVQENIVDDILPDECVLSAGDEHEAKPNSEAAYPVDILNTAILVAIEEKGLSSV